MSFQYTTRRTTKRTLYNKSYTDFTGGVVSLVDEARTDEKSAVRATNLLQTQDGLWTTKWGSAYYGTAPSANNIDGATVYIKTDGTKELIVCAGTVYKSTNDGASWSSISGATFTTGLKIRFVQIGGNLYMFNGTDNLTYYNGTNLTQYTERSAPAWAGTPLARTTLTAGNYTAYYQVTTLNDIGETTGSAEQSITVNKPRNQWTGGEGITLDWDAATGATRYQVYYSDESGFEVLLADVEATATTFFDGGTLEPNPYIEVPDDNTTGGPLFKDAELSENRWWATNDSSNVYRVYFTGTGQNIGYFSPFYGGGYIDIEKGGKEYGTKVVHYRTGKGDSIVTLLTRSLEGKGSIWQIALDSITVGETTFTVPTASKVIGAVGTSAMDSVVKVQGSVFFHSREGFTFLGSKPNLLNVLAADEASVNIRPSLENLIPSKIPDIAAYFFKGRIFCSVPESSIGNDHTYIFDLERRNWQVGWDIGVKSYLEYTDSNNKVKLLGVPLSGTKLIEFGDNINGDLGVAFSTEYASGLYPIDRSNRTTWAKIKYAYLELGRPRGTITFTLLGTEKKRGFSTLATRTISDVISSTGATFDMASNFKPTTSSGIPESFSESSVIKRLRVNKTLNNYQLRVTSSGQTDFYTILSWMVKGKILPTSDPQRFKS